MLLYSQVVSNASAHHVSIIYGKQEVHPIISRLQKKLLKNVTLQVLNFESVFFAINNTKKSKENGPKITPYVNLFISELTEITFKIWRVTF